MYLDAVVGATVCKLAGIEFDERRKDVGHARGGFGRCRQVYVAGSLVHQAACAVGACAHLIEKVLHGNEFVDGVSELLATGCVGLSLAAGGLAEANGLCADSKAGTVHQRHHIFDKT